MSDRPVTWGVVATVAEPAPLLKAFAAHHLACGASEIHLCLDDPADPAANALRQLDKVFVHRSNLDWWKMSGLNRRPPQNRRRQGINATLVSQQTDVDFLLHCDADEFLRPGADVSAALQPLKGTGLWLKVHNLERSFVTGQPIQTTFDGVFKRFPQLKGDAACLQHPLLRNGFTGHGAGKAFVPTGFGYNFAIHAPVIGPVQAREVPPHRRSSDVELLHFDGMTALSWAAKLLRIAAYGQQRISMMVEARRMQLKAVFDCGPDPQAIRGLYAQINAFAPDALAREVAAGRVVTDAFDPMPAIKAHIPGQNVNLTVGHFDRLIQPKLVAWYNQVRDDPEIAI